MMEVANYYRENHPDNDSILLSRTSAPDPVFGISGNSVSTKQGQGVELSVVNEGSTAAKLGLKQGDIIVGINNRRFGDDHLKQLSAEIAAANPGDTISFELLRDGRLLNLTQTFQPAILSGFTLNMDFSVVKD